MKHLAIITARSGSRGLPGKNIRLLNGHPMLAWSIAAALKSGLYDRVIVSTDDEAYADIAQQYRAEVPWLRNASLSGDDATSTDVIVDLLENLTNHGEVYDYFTLLQPTSPLRTAEDLKGAWRMMQEKKASAVVGVSACDHPPQWAGLLPEDLSMEAFVNPLFNRPRQQLQPYYRINGAVYMSSVEAFIREKGFLHSGTYALVMPKERSVDIDDESDFLLAGLLMEKLNYKI
ncbi:MAG TPA: acylneuraminate cytidylyltransferase family protein [Bacteroidales bacterium]|nr:acylneuraminate cytidylyltransferase family protein [Bacteroidales bacterium]HRZ49912.1 acylneuraminate cytidylyltransferase family protein [Bacteroidales bacterium]